MQKLTILTISLIGLGLSGCGLLSPTGTDAVRVEEDFGNSVRQMQNAQIADPVAAEYPPEQAPDGLDGITAEEVLKTYREDASDPDDVEKAFDLDVD